MENAIPLMALKIPYFNNSKISSDVDSSATRHQSSCARVSLVTPSTPHRCEENINTSVLIEGDAPVETSAPATRSNGPTESRTNTHDNVDQDELASDQETIERNGKIVHILKRDGRLQPLSSKKVLIYPQNKCYSVVLT